MEENKMKFGYTIFYVKDVSASITFYEDAFKFKRKFVTDDNLYGELDTGSTTISFAAFEMAKSNGVEISLSKQHLAPIEIAFVTENIQDDFDQAVKAGATLVKAPTAKPWGQQVGYVKDLNGFLIEICSPVH